MAELRIPTTELTGIRPREELEGVLKGEPHARVTLVYYNLYGFLVLAGPRLILRDAWQWFKRPVQEGAPGWLVHGRVARVLPDGAVEITD